MIFDFNHMLFPHVWLQLQPAKTHKTHKHKRNTGNKCNNIKEQITTLVNKWASIIFFY